MGKHYFDPNGNYKGWDPDPGRDPEGLFGSGALAVDGDPLPKGMAKASVSLADGALQIDDAFNSGVREVRKLGHSMILFAAVLPVLIRIADDNAALTVGEQKFIGWLKSDLIPLLPQPNADALRALKVELERRAAG